MPIHLTTLGQLQVHLNGQEVALPANRRVRIAVLVYLAIEREVSREKLASVFWPDSDEEKARHALSQTLYQLRQILGDEWLITTGDRVCVSNTVDVDVTTFIGAIQNKTYDVALKHYSGSFLSDVDHLPSNPNFENWVETQRAHLERLHRQARREVIRLQVAAADHAAAIATARSWITQTPAEDEAHHKLIELLAQSGQVTEAVRHFESYERQLAKEDLRPLDETTSLVTSLKREELPTNVRQGRQNLAVQSPDRRLRPIALVSVVMVVATVITFAASKNRAVALDEKGILVLPFRVIAQDSSFRALGEGVVHLLSTKFGTGDVARSVDPVVAVAEFQRHQSKADELDSELPRQLGRKFGVRHAITGSLVVALDQMTLSARLTDVLTGDTRSASVQGKVSDYLPLIDALAKKLIGGVNNEREDRLETLTSTSFPAVHSYLRGLQSWRTTGAASSVEYFREALEHDSTFALAALRLAVLNDANEPLTRPGTRSAMALAFQHRHRLSKRDQLWLASLAGRHYPRWPWFAEQIRATRNALQESIGSVELSEQLGELLFNAGAFVEEANSLEAAQHVLSKAFESDSLLTEPRFLLFQIAAFREDTAALRNLTNIWFRRHPSHAMSPYVRWQLAAIENDQRALDSVRSIMPNVDRTALYAVFDAAETQGRRIQDAELAMTIMRETRPLGWGIYERDRAMNAGRYREVIDGWKRAAKRNRISETSFLAHRLYFAMYASVDTAGIGALFPEFSKPWEKDVVPTDKTRGYFVEMRCSIEEWRLFNGDRSRVAETISLFRRTPILPNEDADTEVRLKICPEMLEAMAEVTPGGRSIALERLDSLSRAGFIADVSHLMGLNLVISRLWEKQGDRARALAAIRRRWRYQTVYLASYLREEGRLAALEGDRAGALRAYRHFLALRNEPDLELRAERDYVRRELQALERGRRD